MGIRTTVLRNLRQIAVGLVCVMIAFAVIGLLYFGNYSGFTSAVVLFLGLLPILLFLFGERLGSYLSAGDTLSFSIGPFSVNYQKPVEDSTEGATITENRSNYDLMLTIIRAANSEIETELRAMRPDDVDGSVEYILDVIERGLADPINETERILKTNIEMLDYLKTTNDGFCPVANFSGGELTVRIDTGFDVIQAGAPFDLYVDWVVRERGEEAVFRKNAAEVEIVEIEDSGWCHFDIIDWNIDPTEIEGELMDRDPQVKINQDMLRQVPESGLEEAHRYLTEVQNSEQ